MSNTEVYHTPVLLKESVDGMEIAPGKPMMGLEKSQMSV